MECSRSVHSIICARGFLRMESLRLCRGAAAENLCAGRGEIADARPFAGSGTEPSRGGEGACQTFPRAVFHAFTGQGRHRRQYPTRHVPE